MEILLQVILILVNAFFAGTEMAVVSLNATKLRKMQEEGDKIAAKPLTSPLAETNIYPLKD